VLQITGFQTVGGGGVEAGLCNRNDLLRFPFRCRPWLQIQTISSTVFQHKKMCSKSCISILEAAFFARKFASHIFFTFVIPFHVGSRSKSGSTNGMHSALVPLRQKSFGSSTLGGRVFVLQITRFQIVCGEEEFKCCRLQSFKRLRERSMSLSDHRVSSSGGEEFRRYSSQVFRRRLGRGCHCVCLSTKTTCFCPFHLLMLFNCKSPIYVRRKRKKLPSL
jgi:hypothetical protein